MRIPPVKAPFSRSIVTSIFAVSLILALVAAGRSPGASAHVVGTQPLARAEFHNQWTASDAAWRDVLKAYYDGDYEGAAAKLESLLESGADETVVRRNLAVVHKDAGDFDRAAHEYEHLSLLAPDDAHVFLDWGFALLGAGKTGEAARRFRQALKLDDEEPWAYLGLGLAELGQGNVAQATSAVTQAVMIDERLAAAHDFLGRIHHEAGRLKVAAISLDNALGRDPSYLTAYYRLAQVYEGMGRIEDAWRYYKRADRIFTSHPGVQEDVDRFVAEHKEAVRALEQAEAEEKDRTHVRVEPVVESFADAPLIRVGMLEGADQATISAGSAFRIHTSKGAVGGGLLASGVWHLERVGDRVRLSAEDQERQGGPVFLGDEEIRFRLTDPGATWFIYDLEVGQGYFFAQKEDRQVRGDLVVLNRGEGLTLINELDLESYLAGVVPSEVYAGMHPEALKAQAIAARTYALRNLGRYENRGFDVLGGIASAEYRGVSREHENTTAAVAETKGQVLTHRGRLIEALYHASAGGHTASSKDVWGGERAYLKAVPEWDPDEPAPEFPLGPRALEAWLKQIPDVYSSRSRFGLRSTFRWVQPVPAWQIQYRLDRAADIGRILRIVAGERDLTGRVKDVTIVGESGTYTVRGDRIRSFLGGLKANAFKVEMIAGADGYPEFFLFSGAGFGHGVGLSQLGAAGMAEAGYTVREILARYYPDAEITPDYAGGD